MTSPDAALANLGITLPVPAKPVASYVPTRIAGSLLYVSGQLPFDRGELLAKGIVPAAVSLEQAQTCARQAVINGLAAAKAALGSLDRVKGVVRVGVFVACDAGFTDHPKVANGASDLLVGVFGEAGKHARAAVGCPSLPLGAPVEVDLILEIDPAR